MFGDPQEHFTPAFRHGMKPGVGMESRLVRAAEPRQVFQNELRPRGAEGVLVRALAVPQGEPQSIDQAAQAGCPPFGIAFTIAAIPGAAFAICSICAASSRFARRSLISSGERVHRTGAPLMSRRSGIASSKFR